MKDLFVLTADADMLVVFRTLLLRPDALGIRPVSFEVDRHPNRDSGVFRTGPELLRAIAPELEAWLWSDPSSITNRVDLDSIRDPKERLREVFRRKPLPQDFERIAARANLQAWESNPGFRILTTTLQNWFQ